MNKNKVKRNKIKNVKAASAEEIMGLDKKTVIYNKPKTAILFGSGRKVLAT